VKSTSIATAAGLGALTAFPVLALSSLGERLAGLPFLPFDLFDWLARVLPGGLLTFGIDTLVSLVNLVQLGPTAVVAKAAEQGLALLLFVSIGAGFGLLLGILGRRKPEQLSGYAVRGGALLFLGLWLISASLGSARASIVLTGLWLAVLLVGWGWVLAWLIQRAGPALAAEPGSPISRRAFIQITAGGAGAISVGAWGLGRVFGRPEAAAPAVVLGDTAGTVDSPPAEVLAGRIAPAPGTRAEITSNEAFYRIDINTREPQLDPSSWRLELGGLVDSPLSLTLDELRAMPAVSYYHTLSCISNPIGGDLISTTRWTGVRVMDVLELAKMRSNAQELFIEAADGFYESVEMADLIDQRTILAYEMNGAPLPHEHGYPLRIIIPNRYGMKQPKWIVNMEVLDHEGEGYWVERGWSAEAFVRLTSVVDAVAREAVDEAAGTLPVGGIAYAGASGISRVDVQVDDGPWAEAKLRAPALSGLTWVQWRYDWPVETGRHTFRVRATDSNGNPQIETSEGVRPDGATGLHDFKITI
jgi:DMSO/TMAO reductase YedYZ molybdopterin-dependent catalytic subunit